MPPKESTAAEYLDLNWLSPWEKNPRINKDAIPKIKESIERFGFTNPILASPDGKIIAGHTRYFAALEMGIETVPVRILSNLSKDEAVA